MKLGYELHREALERRIKYYEKWANNPRFRPEFRERMAKQLEWVKKELQECLTHVQ